MSDAHDVSARVRELEQILTRSSDMPAAMRAGSLDGGRPGGVPVERIRRLTAALRALPDDRLDAASSLGLRILLDDCAEAIGRLRGATRDTADRLDGVAATVQTCGKLLWRERKLARKDTGREPVPAAGSDDDGS